MRKDIYEKVFEDGCHTYDGNSGNRRARRQAPEDTVLCEGMTVRHRGGHDSKDSGINLRPLFRYLAKQVGRPWNDVYSEIDPSLREFAKRRVYTKVQRVDGKILSMDGRPYEVRHPNLYVDPYDGILKACSARKKTKWRSSRTPNPNICLSSNPLIQYHCMDGVWYEITFRPVVDTDYTKTDGRGNLPEHAWKIYPPNRAICLEPKSFRTDQWRYFFGSLIYPIKKRQLNKREIRNVVKSRYGG